MAIFKCKICGGTLEFQDGATVGICDSCGTPQPLPKLDTDRKANLLDRAGHFRRNNEFDKAMAVYEQLISEDPADAELYWLTVLCRYGIEYVEDPASRKYVPTVNRAQYTAVVADEDYKSALKYADSAQRRLYEADAAVIDEIQKGILAISQKEEPFDIFICYKESGPDGRRTPDSVLANDLYHQLTLEGFKVFFSRITLEDKLGTAYEPYIFAALNSARVMVVLGTRPEYFNAVWVKNEWSRYLALIRKGEDKMLIPAYRDMDPYDLPEEFSHLQAQDMAKLGFMQDLIHGIKKIVAADVPAPTPAAVASVASAPANTAPLLKRAFMSLEDGEFDRVNEFCEQVLNQDPENALAYLAKLMSDLQIRNRSALKDHPVPFDGNNNYVRALRFADPALKKELEEAVVHIKDRNEIARKEGMLLLAKKRRRRTVFALLSVAAVCVVWIATVLLLYVIIPNAKYNKAVALMDDGAYEEAIAIFAELGEYYRDSAEQIDECNQGILELQAKDLIKAIGDPKVGDTVKFGTYEQDNDTANGAEEIEWTVLDKQDGKILVVSKYGLDAQPYNTEFTPVTWEICTLRDWLNHDFYNTAFGETHQAMIEKTEVSAEDNKEYNTDAGNDTSDHVFLLSIGEAEQYFSTWDSRACKPTAYAVAQGAYVNSENGNCWWWLRSPGYRQDSAATVITPGGVDGDGRIVNFLYFAVRPALWIDLNS